MSKNIEKNIWKRNNLAPLEYCSVSRAAKILNCEEEDIMHWCYTERINLCINFSRPNYFYMPFLKEDGDVIEQITSLNNSALPSGNGIPFIFSDKFKSGNCYIPNEFHLIETKEYYLVQSHMEGMWPIDASVLHAINSDGYFSPTEISLFMEENPEFKSEGEVYQFISPPSVKKLFIGNNESIKDESIKDESVALKYLDHLCEHAPDIHKKQYEPLIAGYYIEYINKHAILGAHMPVISKHKDIRTLTSPKTTEIHKERTTAKQSTYIASLMNALGVSEEMMRFGSIGQIKDFLSRKMGKEIEMPVITDDTLDDWLKRAGKR
ncbi:hypothetical protein [Enterobacter roggenkampii]|uniref:hypothetical protein n=1 Tax=Enterobacter roggenkampii TaxID=1812935 RepID=UPI0015E4EF4C|nr:hypothetical protein [Enterobacter roggenkampii]QLP23379.1 hypothetical protein HV027_14495 [Enterobacter roggenkampii]